MYYDLLDPSRNWPEFLVKDLTKRVYEGLRSEDRPAPKEPDVAPRVLGDLLMPRSFRAPVPHYAYVPRWDGTNGEGERRASITGDSGADGAEDGRTEGLDGQ